MQVFNELVLGEHFHGCSCGLAFMGHASGKDGSSPRLSVTFFLVFLL